jgi:outer membrane lipoprotein-sorting protein
MAQGVKAMNKSRDQEENRFAELLGAIESQTPPDQGFLKRLEAESRTAFLAAERPQSANRKEKIMRIFKKFTPAAAACIVVGAVAVVAFFVLWDGAATIAWADVQAAVVRARTGCYKLTLTQGPSPSVSWDVMFKEPGLMRQERPEAILICDYEKGHFLFLAPEAKTAHTGYISEMPKPFSPEDWVGYLRKIIGSEQAEELGEKEIQGRRAKGWRIARRSKEIKVITVWADAETAELIEVQLESDQAKMVMSEFEFDRELDESLFSLEPPDDYDYYTHAEMKASDPSVEDVAVLLRFWAKGNGNVFPNNLNPWEFVKAAKEFDDPSEIDPEVLEDTISRAFAFLGMQFRWTYAGKGVKLGEAETPVFWFKPKRSRTYKVIYGDLHIEDVAEEDLPKEPSPPN